MSTQTPRQHDHTTRQQYGSTLRALQDAQRVHSDLLAAITGHDALFIDADRIEFLARRTQQLLSACIDTERRNV